MSFLLKEKIGLQGGGSEIRVDLHENDDVMLCLSNKISLEAIATRLTVPEVAALWSILDRILAETDGYDHLKLPTIKGAPTLAEAFCIARNRKQGVES